MPRSLIVAHRGGVLGQPGVPENTLAAFEGAIGLGADMIEFDVRRTSAGELVVCHDPVIAGVPVGSSTRAEITARTGVQPALLVEVLDLTAGRIQLDVELKEDGYVDEVHAVVRGRFAPDEVVFTSFLDPVVGQVKKLDPASRTGLLVGLGQTAPAQEAFPVRRAEACGADFVCPHFLLAKLGILARGWRAGLPCLVWTVNDATVMKTFLTDPRVGGLITDRPARALAVRDALTPGPRTG